MEVPPEHRLQQLEEARGLAMDASYDAALDVVEKVLAGLPDDLEGLRLKGNVLEQKALDLNEHSAKKLVRSGEYLLARECYERILRSDPDNVFALVDLGDHYKNLEAYDRAFSYYEAAVSSLQSDRSFPHWSDAVADILATCIDLKRRGETVQRAERLERACGALETNDG